MKIVVAYENRVESRAALEWAIEAAKPDEAAIAVVGSIRGGSSRDSGVKEVLAYRHKLDEAERLLEAQGIPHEIRRYARGKSFAEDILEDVAEHGADMIVVGLHHRPQSGKLTVGGRARAILLGAECPVVAVKPRVVKVVESIDVALALDKAENAWNAYMTEMIVRFDISPATREITERFAEAEPSEGMVQFAQQDDGTTRVTLMLQYDASSEAAARPGRIEELHRELNDVMRGFKKLAEGVER